MGDKLFAIPFRALGLKADRKEFVYWESTPAHVTSR